MPAKIVYGKSRKAARGREQTVGFDRFLMSSPLREGSAAVVGDELLGELEKGVGALTVSGEEEGVGGIAGVDEDLERSMGRLGIGEKREEGDGGLVEERKAKKKEKKRERERKKKEKENQKEGETKAPTETPTPKSTADARVRTPRQTPNRTPKAKRRVELTPASRPHPAQLLTPEPTPEPEDIYSAYVAPLLAVSDCKTLLTFDDWAKELDPHFEITKIAEASFSEVYRLSSTSPTTDGTKAESVLKVVALKTPPCALYPCQSTTRAIRDFDTQLEKEISEREEKDQFKSHVADVLSEVRLLQNLNHIPGFTVFRDLSLVRGRLSSSFTTAWSTWNKSRPRGKKSEFPDPAKKASYDDTQLWAIIEMQDAGTDCEKLMEAGGLTTIWEVWDVFWGVACSIAKAEEAVKFEHRDLHLGNICVRDVRGGCELGQVQIEEPLKRKMRFTGVETTVIDYTLSRADIIDTPARPSPSGKSAATKETDVAYLNLDVDPALFEGDASQEYQYEIYRYMRGAALFGNPMQWEPSPESHQKPIPELIKTAVTTPRHSPRKNTHIRFDDDNDDDNETQKEKATAVVSAPRRSPRKHNPGPLALTPASPQPPLQPQPQPENPWKFFHPQTNLLWLHFLLHKLLAHLSLHSPTHKPQAATASAKATTKAKVKAKADSRNERTVVVLPAEDGESLDAAKLGRKAAKLHKVLGCVAQMLCPVALGREGALGSVKEVVVLGLERRWVGVGDVEG